MNRNPVVVSVLAVLCLLSSAAVASAAVPGHRSVPARRASSAHRTYHARHHYVSAFDPAKYDAVDYDEPEIRELAIAALGHEKGSVVAVDPSNGRILTIVDQKMAFGAGFEPCSTIKPVIALAGLQEGVITRETMIKVGSRRYMDLTEAMAHSNNKFFEEVGSKLGFDVVHKYASLVGLGQRVGYEIPEEQPGYLPSKAPAFGGVARMSSFGEGIRITPFQLAALVSALANGGTLYYLQYPRTAAEKEAFEPRVRQQLDVASLLPDIREGMLAAVLYGTAKRSYDPYGEQALGKTGTCNDEGVGGRLGWFVSYADELHPKIVIVVLLHGGGRIVSGPHASGIAGRIYRGLYQRNYFVETSADHVSQNMSATTAGDSH